MKLSWISCLVALGTFGKKGGSSGCSLFWISPLVALGNFGKKGGSSGCSGPQISDLGVEYSCRLLLILGGTELAWRLPGASGLADRLGWYGISSIRFGRSTAGLFVVEVEYMFWRLARDLRKARRPLGDATG